MRPGLASLREFRLLWASGLLASLGAQMSVLALPLLVLRQTGSAVQAGVIGTVSVGALLLTTLPGGALADAVERRRLMRVCEIGSLLAVSALTIFVINGRSPLVLVLLVAGVGAVINSFYGPAALGLLRAVVPADLVGVASARMQARAAVSRLVGPLVGGALFGLHPAAPFLAEAVALMLSLACLSLMRTRSKPGRQSGPVFGRRQLAAGIAFIWNQPYLRTVLLVFGVGMNSAFSAMVFVALAIASDNGHSGLGGGAIVSLIAAGTLAGSLLAPRLRPDERPGLLVAVTCWTCAGAVAILTLVHPPVLIGLLAAACMATASVASIGFLTTLLLMTPDDKVGRVQSAAGFMSSLAQPMGPLAAGALLGVWGETVTFALLGVTFTLCAVVVTWAPSVRRRSAEEAAARGGDRPVAVTGEEQLPTRTSPAAPAG
jgi:MFS family permease